MNLEQQVVSLELAKKLKELGVKQESLFMWVEWDNAPDSIELSDSNDWTDPEDTAYSAFTVAELGEMLNGKFPNVFMTYRENISGTMLWICIARTDVEGMMERNEYKTAQTEANARAKMLIYLVENNLITLQ